VLSQRLGTNLRRAYGDLSAPAGKTWALVLNAAVVSGIMK
jgi:hypothetical protein